MTEYAPIDYEPTPEEAIDTFAYFKDAEPGHGMIEMVPAMEKWIWSAERVWWSGREALPDGRVRLEWLIPEKLPH